MRQYLSQIIVIILAVSIILMVKPIDAQTIPKPSIPEFTLKYVDRSYDVPPTYVKDPYTGNEVMTYAGYHVQNRTIDIIIKNQLFTSTKLSDGNVTGLFYSVRSKGHYIDWIDNVQQGPSPLHIPTTESADTVITIMLDNSVWDINSGEMDFQVQAEKGFWVFDQSRFSSMFYGIGENTFSGWSPTKTVNIPASYVSPTQRPNTTSSPNPSPTVPEYSFLPILSLLIVIPLIMIIVRKRIYQKAYY